MRILITLWGILAVLFLLGKRYFWFKAYAESSVVFWTAIWHDRLRKQSNPLIFDSYHLMF